MLPIFVVAALSCLIANLQWYRIKATLSRHGYKTNWFSGHLRDISNLLELRDKTKDPPTKWRLNALYYSWLIAVFVFLLSAFLLFR